MCICHFCTVCVCLCVCGVSVCRVCASVSLCCAAFSEITVCLSSARRCVCVCAESSITVFASRLDSMYVVSSQCKKARRITAENYDGVFYSLKVASVHESSLSMGEKLE